MRFTFTICEKRWTDSTYPKCLQADCLWDNVASKIYVGLSSAAQLDNWGVSVGFPHRSSPCMQDMRPARAYKQLKSLIWGQSCGVWPWMESKGVPAIWPLAKLTWTSLPWCVLGFGRIGECHAPVHRAQELWAAFVWDAALQFKWGWGNSRQICGGRQVQR